MQLPAKRTSAWYGNNMHDLTLALGFVFIMI